MASISPRARATRCPAQHYKGLVKLNQAYGLCQTAHSGVSRNQFLKQESGSAEEILAGARGRGFDGAGMHLMKKVKVNGPDADEVFLYLKQGPCRSSGTSAPTCGRRRRHRGVDAGVHRDLTSAQQPGLERAPHVPATPRSLPLRGRGRAGAT